MEKLIRPIRSGKKLKLCPLALISKETLSVAKYRKRQFVIVCLLNEDDRWIMSLGLSHKSSFCILLSHPSVNI